MTGGAAQPAPDSGQDPASAGDTRERILAATVRCVETFGAQRTSTSLIARTAGVSRPTLYAYFANREELVELATQQAIRQVVVRMQQHCRQYPSAGERAVEALLYAVYDLRHEPAMATHFAITDVIREPLTRDEHWFASQALVPAAELSPALHESIDDAAELYTRILISLLIREPMRPRSRAGDRAFLRRWWPRALGIAPD